MAEPLLLCEGLDAGWGETQVVSNISLALPRGEVLAILGRNGVGKTTLLCTLIGRAQRRGGTISFDGRRIELMRAYDRAALGIGFVPQEREIFGTLSVRENLQIAARASWRTGTASPGRVWNIERVLDLFPRLGERMNHGGQQLSGGEQQMLSIARALMGNPRVLLLDEPMEGLAPVIIEQLVEALQRLRAESDIAIVLVEQHIELALDFTDRVVVLDRGVPVYDNQDGVLRPDRARIATLTGIAEM